MSPRRISPASVVRLLGAWRGERVGPAYSQLADSLRLLVLDGRLPLDVVLPGERELASALEVSRTTVTAAFAQPRDEGFLERRQGGGALMADAQAEGVLDVASAAPPASEAVHGAYAAALSALPAHLPQTGYG